MGCLSLLCLLSEHRRGYGTPTTSRWRFLHLKNLAGMEIDIHEKEGGPFDVDAEVIIGGFQLRAACRYFQEYDSSHHGGIIVPNGFMVHSGHEPGMPLG